MNALHPDRMTTRERLDEVGSILALGLVRLKARQSSELVDGEANSPLHSCGAESVCRSDRNGELR